MSEGRWSYLSTVAERSVRTGMATLCLLLSSVLAFGQGPGLVHVVGSLAAPDGTPLEGKVTIQLVRPTTNNTCTTPVSVVNFQMRTQKVVDGDITGLPPVALYLYATECLSPVSIPLCDTTKQNPASANCTLYLVKVYDNTNRLLYTANWYVPFVSAMSPNRLQIRQPIGRTINNLGGTIGNSGGGTVDITWCDPK